MSHGFCDRLAYLRRLDNFGRVKPETDPEFATRAGVEYGWLQKWKKRSDSPKDRELCKRLAEALRVSQDWLFDGRGVAPEPEMWARWTAQQEGGNGEAAPRPAKRRAVRESAERASTPPGDSMIEKKRRRRDR